MIPKSPPWKSTKYLAFVRTLPCVVCDGAYGDSEPHHLIGHKRGAMGAKHSDFETFPLCHRHHRELHDCGYTHWEDWHGDQHWHILKTIKAALVAGILKA